MGQCRIIAGRWRGRKLPIPDLEGLRPTPDRVRETVFNWLQPIVGSARCLDLFAGSGALGFEAASRGAENVTLVESNTIAAKQLRENGSLLSAENCRVESMTAQQFLTTNSERYDIVFIDPPYQENLWTDIALQLVETDALLENAHIYLECPSKGELPKLPTHWQLIKDKKAGEVRYCLFLNNVGDAV
ncbi:MAG: 16S rRNA (guanine(966)-N(2))-methyltransferase RsmD [Gammaproteobacteria bacterium]|nr:16S rRNA (guanine(966)-N(2))-methyltransferase RsmD [Gammaproteobacteria bacterium]